LQQNPAIFGKQRLTIPLQTLFWNC